MKIYRLFLTAGLFLLIAAVFSCKKMNLATELGEGLIPAVDNVTTFDTTMEVASYNGIFADTTKTGLSYEQFLGVINNDPIFGKTDARMYFELLPQSRTPFNNIPSKRILDSVVLILNYVESYGDTVMPQTIQVAEMSQSNDFRYDSSYRLSNNNWVSSGILGSKTVIPASLKDSVKIPTLYKDADSATANQLRIRLNDVFGNRLLSYDTSGINNAYYSDSVFRTFFKGFALQSTGGGNAIIGINLLGANSKLAVYYRYENTTTAGDQDTAVAYFKASYGSSVYGNYSLSACANYIGRDYSGTQMAATSGDNTVDNLVYIQNSPGTFARLVIPGLTAWKQANRQMVIHTAELMVQSVFDASDTLFNAPKNLFLDVFDDTASKHKVIPYVFNDYYSNGTISGYSHFYGNANRGYYTFAKDASGNPIKQWKFFITRYLQNVFRQQTSQLKPLPVYEFRLYAPSYVNLPMDIFYGGAKTAVNAGISLDGSVYARGRVRLGGGNHPTQKMKLRIVYSKV